MTQIIRGKVFDQETQTSLPFANISVLTVNLPVGTTADNKGNFRLKNVPVGRHQIQISFMGYETIVIPEWMVSSGKEVVLQIGLKEKITQMDEVVVIVPSISYKIEF